MTILVFDSGIGGLTVLREARVLLPGARFVYVADDAAFPYGNWDEDALRERLVDLFGRLIDTHRPDLSILACNTASTVSLGALRSAYPAHPFVGTVPAIKPAAERTRSRLVSVLATPVTITREYTHALIRQYASRCEVQLVGSRALAGLAEQYMREGAIDEAAVRDEIAPCFVEQDGLRTDIVVLACTHYPFLVNRMRKMAPWPVDWLDPSEAIARRARSLLPPGDGSTSEQDEPANDVAVFTSGAPDAAVVRLMRGFGLETV